MKKFGLILYLICVTVNDASIENDSPFSKATRSAAFVDKSSFIKVFILNLRAHPVTYVTYPRGYGKTTNLDMIKRFMELPTNNDTKEANDRLFLNPALDLMIVKDKPFFNQYYGKYPTISLDLYVSGQITDPNQIIDALKDKIMKAFEPYEWLYTTTVGTLEKYTNNSATNTTNSTATRYPLYTEIDVYKRLVRREANAEEWLQSIAMLASDMRNFYGKGVTLLIDDFDAGITTSFSLGVHLAIFPFLYDLLDNIFRVYPRCLTQVVSFGTLPIAFLEIPQPYHFLQENNVFQKYFGFTKGEMISVYQSPKITPKMEPDEVLRMEEYYSGYRTKDGKLQIFNPLSVTNYLTGSRPELINHWSRPEIIMNFFKCFENQNVRIQIEELILKGTVQFELRLDYSCDDLDRLGRLTDPNGRCHHSKTYDAETYFSLLFHLGYLTHTDEKDTFAIPNRDVKLGFLRDIQDFYSEITKVDHAMLVRNFKAIADRNFVLEEMTVKLIDILNGLFGGMCKSSVPGFSGNSTDGDFHVLLYSVLDLNRDGNFEVVEPEEFVDSLHKNGSLIPGGDRVNIFILSLNEENVIFVEIKYGTTFRRVKQYVEKYRPLKDDDELPNYVKTLAIHVRRDCTVQVEFCHDLKRGDDGTWIIVT